MVLTCTSVLAYNERIADIAECIKREYGIVVEPDVDPFWTTPSGRLLAFFGLALFISGIFVVGSEEVAVTS
jgi:hypothetical protein